MKKPAIILIILLSAYASSYGQKRDTASWVPLKRDVSDIGLILGVHQFRNTFFELGISHTQHSGPGCFWSSYFRGYSASAEYNPFQNRAGITVTAWSSLLNVVVVGVNLNSYTNFEKYNLGMKPFIGIGPGFFSLTYGYNFQAINNHIGYLNRHCFSLRCHLAIKERN